MSELDRFEDKIDKILDEVTILRVEQARHDERAQGFVKALEDHTRSDAANFLEIKETLDELKLKNAVDDKIHKRNSVKVSGIVSLIITAIVSAILGYFGLTPASPDSPPTPPAIELPLN